MKNTVATQKGTGGSSAMQNTSTGSGSRPKGSNFPIKSTNPSHPQKIRPKNSIG